MAHKKIADHPTSLLALPGLCVFSSAEISFRKDIDFYTQFLDQLAQYVAKHLIWLCTFRPRRWNGKDTSVLPPALPGEAILEHAPTARRVQLPTGTIGVIDFWSGYWPGEAARARTPAEHLRHIKPHQRCWCGLNRPMENVIGRSNCAWHREL